MTTRTLILVAFAACALAQPKPKPTLTPADYGKWETLGAATLSPDGKWLAYEIRRTGGDNELRVAATGAPSGPGGKTHVLAFCSAAAFSADSRWLACSATVSEAEQDRARKAGRPAQDKLNVLDLGSGEITKVDDVQSLAFSGVGPYLAFRKYPPAGAGRVGAGTAPAVGGGRGGRGGGAPDAAADAERDPAGAVLLVRDL